jgi:hypothetical protein
MRRALGWIALALAGCTGAPTGIGEPIVVHGATFVAGPLPGSPPPDGGTPASPDVTAIQSSNNAFFAGQAGAAYTGDVTDDATAIAVCFPDLGTGYWVMAPGPPDGTDPGNLTWSMTFDIGASTPPGLHNLRFAAIDAAGASGSQVDQPVCVDTPYPDNYNACQPSRAPPAVVLSLAWDEPVDLDLVLVAPGGTVLSNKHPSTGPLGDAGVLPGDGALDRDSDADCVADGRNREDVVWKQAPVAGTYLAYANLASACGKQAVRFTLTLYVAEPADGGQALVPVLTQAGEMLALQANGGTALGLYVAAFSFPWTSP